MGASFAKGFEDRTGYKVVATYAGTSDEMFAKIKAGGSSTYDMVTASGDLAKRLHDANLPEPVDLAKVPNSAKLFKLFQKPPYNTFDGKPYGVSIGGAKKRSFIPSWHNRTPFAGNQLGSGLA